MKPDKMMESDNIILVIDDDTVFCRNVATYFTQRGQPCKWLDDPKLILSWDLSKVALILLDIDMPAVTGLTLLPMLKANRDIPIIMVSGVSDADTRVSALTDGADYYFVKPVGLEELYLTCTRRLSLAGPRSGASDGIWTLDQRRRLLTSPEGTTVGLTLVETRLLSAILCNAPNDTDRPTLLEILSGRPCDDPRAIRSLEVTLSRIRTRFRHYGETLPIRSTRNVGYCFLGTAKILG
jgi:two-component system, OmpR family, response regulator